ncbi:MAG: UDP-N-acetylmuramoyl-L-alanyl-D-glutamate--2,6-diaminopimelate ligase [bacterium]|nr:UDP-N-acetylmuramoyl-L-alanyl-D-glutamate--2,6-diaminopimelate ligase [bacterium]
MRLAKIINGLDLEIKNFKDVEVSGISLDSRDIKKATLFVAVKGKNLDGNKFIGKAVKKGASAILTSEKNSTDFGVPVIFTDSINRTVSLMAKNFYSNPLSEIKVIGVTGTNGKTTTTYLLRSIYGSSERTGVIGTIRNIINNEIIHTENTTPDPVRLFNLFAKMRDSGVKKIFMEVSSHGLKLDRVFSIEFDAAVFTNLTQDHMDFHMTMADYRESKEKLFKMLKKDGFSVINADDRSFKHFVEASSPRDVVTFGVRNRDADWVIDIKSLTLDGSMFTITERKSKKSFDVSIPLVGDHNIYNSACGFITAYRMKRRPAEIIEGLKNACQVDGRFEKFYDARGFYAVVDYAHTPDALERLLRTAKRLTKNRVITLFGCGGDRDREKRPIMGKIATHLSDYVIITSDNPRSENPELIIKDILGGVKEKNWVVEINRSRAIKKGFMMAKSGDTLIIAGKGHEDYQIIGNKKYHFDDREEVGKNLKK